MSVLCRQGMGSVPGALGGLNLGGLDLSSMLSNPALMNMVWSVTYYLQNIFDCYLSECRVPPVYSG